MVLEEKMTLPLGPISARRRCRAADGQAVLAGFSFQSLHP